jgi:histidyl-tRNA synthetase
LGTNPLRILDSKNPAMKAIVESAPQILNYLGEESLKHFEGVQKLLKANNLPFTINPRLVRGLDYYNLTVFEWVTTELGSQGTVAGGGRYDPLIAQMGGKAAPACGWAMGMERVIELMKEQGLTSDLEAGCDIYMLHQAGETLEPAFIMAERLRSAGIEVILQEENSIKSSAESIPRPSDSLAGDSQSDANKGDDGCYKFKIRNVISP